MYKKHPFIPQKKPKSWVISVILALSYFGFCLLFWFFDWLGIANYFSSFLSFFMMACLLGALAAGVFYMRRWKSEYYRNLTSKLWKEQVW